MKQLFSSSSVRFSVLSILASALNFLFYPVISHLLSLSQFGDVQAGVSFVMLSAALFTSLSTLALFAAAHSTNERSAIQHIERLVITVSVLLAIALAISAEPMSRLLQLHDASLLYMLSIIFILNIPAATWVGTLQGGGQFIESGWISVASAATKIITAWVFITVGLGAHGALIGIALGTFIALPLVRLVESEKRSHYRNTFSFIRRHDFVFFRRKPVFLIILVALSLLSFLGSIDVLIAKIVLAPETAGSYAQLSTAAKIPFFAAIPVSLILFERLVKRTVQIRRAFPIFGAIIITASLGTLAFEHIILRLLFGITGNTSVFPLLILAFAALSFITLASYAMVANRQATRLAVMSVGSLVLSVLLFALYQPATMEGVAQLYASSTLATLLISLILTYTYRHERN